MSPDGSVVVEIFGEGGGEQMAAQMSVPFLGRIPVDPDVMRSCEADVPYVERFTDTEAARAFAAIARAVLGLEGGS